MVKKGEVMSRRGENIHKRKDGRWEARIITKNNNFQTKYKSVYAHSYSELKNKLYEINISKISSSSNKIKFEQVVTEWLSSIKHTVKESTYSKYCITSEKHILPYFRNSEVSNLCNRILQNFIIEKAQKGNLNNSGGLSAKSVHDIYSVMLQIIKFAEKNNYISHFNTAIDLPKVEEKFCAILSETDKHKLEQFIRKDTDLKKVGILLVMYTGIRIGELCALKWNDIDLENGFVSITKTLQRIKNTDQICSQKTKIIIDSPKSQKSVRKIPLQSFLIEILSGLKNNCSENAFLLTGSKTKFIEPRAYEKTYKNYLKECDIPNIKFHALRHTFATNAVEMNFDAKSLSEILGHSTVRFTLDRYVHPSDKTKRENMEKLVSIY